MVLGSGLVTLGTVAALSAAVASTLLRDEYLGIMGAIPRSFAPVLYLPWLALAVAVLMVVIAIRLWRHRLRSFVGRIGFSFAAALSMIGAANLLLLVQ